MKRQRIVLAALGTTLAASAAACGGTLTSSELDLQARLNADGVFGGSGNAAGVGLGSGGATGGTGYIGGGGIMSGTGTGDTTAPTDTTKRIGFIGSGG